jgi:hypothetical protein
MPQFQQYISIDYSGAKTADSSCKGLRVYVAAWTGTPTQPLIPTPSPQQFWSRRCVVERD